MPNLQVTQSVYNWLDSTVESFNREQKSEDRRPITEKADPLALSWASYYLWTKMPQRRWVQWQELEAHEHDRVIAEQTRQYYRNKIAIRALKSGGELTKFARDLYDICNGGIMREQHRGLLYRLPYFFVEDMARETLWADTKAVPEVGSLPLSLEGRSARQLQPHSRIFHSRRSRETMEYWYHDVETGYPIMLPVAYDNSLRSIIDYHFRTAEAPTITARWHLKQSRNSDFRFWMIYDPEIHFE